MEIIDYKEALIFAFLGVLRYLGKENILRSATGAKTDSIGGTIHNNILSQ
jgi:anhydro-N-acetylmuramic acid kinase